MLKVSPNPDSCYDCTHALYELFFFIAMRMLYKLYHTPSQPMLLSHDNVLICYETLWLAMVDCVQECSIVLLWDLAKEQYSVITISSVTQNSKRMENWDDSPLHWLTWKACPGDTIMVAIKWRKCISIRLTRGHQTHGSLCSPLSVPECTVLSELKPLSKL